MSERAVVYELGYRAQRGNRFLFDAALFHNDYSNLLSLEPGAPFAEIGDGVSRSVLPLRLANGLRGTVSGAEVAGDVRVTDAWRLHGSYSLLSMDLRPREGSRDTTTATSTEGSSPRHRVVLRSSLTLGPVQLDAVWRHISALPAQEVAAYSSLNARGGWRPWSALEIAIVGRDLLRSHHPEFGGGTEIERSVYGELAWRF
jgi:iron complex outermembrane receptor protein